jgi:crotonobetainyl-CoA:carnitine CoA-transferase CaiB-like acyl-CoA transferase
MRHAGAKRVPGMGAMFLHANQGKQSIVLDLKSAEDTATLREMLPAVDVLVHNVRPQAMQRLALDDEAVRRLNPSIIYAELTGYAEGGPLHGRAAYDDVIQAQSGLAELFARQTGEAPMYVPTLIADRVTGITAAHAILAALYKRRQSGLGETLRISMFETMAAFVLADHLGGASFEPAAGPMGYSRLLTRYRRPYRTKDGFIAAVVYNDKHWRAFFDAIGQLTAFEADYRFKTAAARADNYDAIYGYLADVMTTRTTEAWLTLLEAADIPCARVSCVEDLLSDRQLRAVGFFEESDCGDAGQRRIAARYRSPAASNGATRRAPALDERILSNGS